MTYSHHIARAIAETNVEMAENPLSVGSKAIQGDQFKGQFGAVLSQLQVDEIAPLALSVRRNLQARDSTEQTDPSHSGDNAVTSCKVIPGPLCGSYNIAYRVLFDDGVEWILKVPATGSHTRFDRIAADAMTSEALTMKMIKQYTTIPVPAVHSFDVSMDNEVGCPYILMDFLKGKPLYEGWFDPNASSAKREQFRARALSTIAAAMVQLNKFTTHHGGSLRFDSNGQPVGVAGAKIFDATTFFDIVDQGFRPEHDLWCENGPTNDPSSYLLFTMNRRGYKNEDSAFSRGVHDSARLFTQWALESSSKLGNKGQEFVLAHPDFDLQNMLVDDEGTLCGILDWDGVAAVPISVGCLKYPSWLVRDWDPVNYNWNTKAHKLKSYSGRLENTPDELVAYRAMYAQFIEMLLPLDPASSGESRMGADITRLSLITTALQVAVDRPEDIAQMIGHIFREIKRVIREKDDDESSDTESFASDIRSDVCEAVDSDTNSLLSGSDFESKKTDEESEPTELEESSCQSSAHEKQTTPENFCKKCIANLNQSSWFECDDEDEHGCSALHATEISEFENTDGLETQFSDRGIAEETTCDQNTLASRKCRIAKWALGLGIKAFKEIAKILYKRDPDGSKHLRKVSMAKRVLEFGEKGCTNASKVFHKEYDEMYCRQPNDRTEAMSALTKSDPNSKTAQAIIGVCDLTDSLLRKIISFIHRGSAHRPKTSNPKDNKTEWIQTLGQRLPNMLKNIWEPVENDKGLETGKAAEGRTPQNSVPIDTQYCGRCNHDKGDPTREEGHGCTKEESGNVWAHIAAEVDKAGIAISTIQKRRDVIAQYVIENLRLEVERTKEESCLKNEGVARKMKNARQQIRVTSADHKSDPDPIQDSSCLETRVTITSLTETSMSEMEAAQIGMPKESVVDGKTDMTHRTIPDSLPGVERPTSTEIQNPGSAKSESGNHESNIAVPQTAVPRASDADSIRPPEEQYRSSEPESLISKLEAAKQRFDIAMALKGRNSTPANLGSGKAIPQPVRPKVQTPTQQDVTKSKPTEDVDRNLRLASQIAKPQADDNINNNLSRSEIFEVAGRDSASTAQLDRRESTFSKQNIPPTSSSRAIVLANEKLKAVLASMQNSKDAPLTKENDDDDIEEIETGKPKEPSHPLPPSHPQQQQQQQLGTPRPRNAVRKGRWFETASGRLAPWDGEERASGNGGLESTGLGCGVAIQIDDEIQFVREGEVRRASGGEGDKGTRIDVDDDDGGSEGCMDPRESGGVEARVGRMRDGHDLNMRKVCEALGEGRLDDERMRLLREWFETLADEAMGRK